MGAGHWYWLVYNDRWQQVGTWRAGNWDYAAAPINDVNPKETFVHHAAGLDGRGGSSYIDSVILRDSDNSDNGPTWTQAASPTRGGRLYYLQNWRADVVVTVNDSGVLIDQIRYSPYGVPTRLSLADLAASGSTYTNGTVDLGPDGDLSVEDFSTFLAAFTEESPVADLVSSNGGSFGRDGQVSVEDFIAFLAAYSNDVGSTGRGLLARSDTANGGNRRGYAGYEYAEDLRFASRNVAVPAGASGATQLRPRAMYHVRYRVYDAEQGRWTRWDPLGYVDGMSLVQYALSSPASEVDPFGLKLKVRPIPLLPQIDQDRIRRKFEETIRSICPDAVVDPSSGEVKMSSGLESSGPGCDCIRRLINNPSDNEIWYSPNSYPEAKPDYPDDFYPTWVPVGPPSPGKGCPANVPFDPFHPTSVTRPSSFPGYDPIDFPNDVALAHELCGHVLDMNDGMQVHPVPLDRTWPFRFINPPSEENALKEENAYRRWRKLPHRYYY